MLPMPDQEDRQYILVGCLGCVAMLALMVVVVVLGGLTIGVAVKLFTWVLGG